MKPRSLQNASEVLREGLGLIEDREAREKARLTALRGAARVGVADIESGRFRIFDSQEELERYLSRIADEVVSLRSL